MSQIQFKDVRNDPRNSKSSIFEGIERLTGRFDLSEVHISISYMQNNALWNDVTTRLHREDPTVKILPRTPTNISWLHTYADGSLHEEIPVAWNRGKLIKMCGGKK